MSVRTVLLNRMYVNGQWVKASSKEDFPVYNPANGQRIGAVPNGNRTDAIFAVDAATDAFNKWSEKTADERSHLLRRWYDCLLDYKTEIAETIVLEQGKPMKEALAEITNAANYLLWFGEEAKRVYGETIPATSKQKRMIVIKQPIGVVACITPWTMPASMITRKVGSALAAGCTVVVKPSGKTPLTALKLAETSELAGIPKGVFNVITGNSSEIGKAWLEDPRVQKLSFTGSTETGKLLMKTAADQVKKLTLELSGHAPFIVFADADIYEAVNGVIQSKFYNSGQNCLAANRIYVQEQVIEQFIDLLRFETSKLVVGNGLDPSTNIGPLINKESCDRMEFLVHDAIKNGAKIQYGGKRLSELDNGYFFEPTILSHVDDDMSVMKEESIGPFVSILPFHDLNEVINRANNSPFGLCAFAYTNDLRTAITVYEKLQYGIVGINDSNPSVVQAPMGGLRESGFGKEGGRQGMEEFLDTKYVSIKI